MSVQKSEIKFGIHLDDKKIPERIEWQADGAPGAGVNECKAFLMSLWDDKGKSTLKIDLWTKDMPVDDMKRFFCESMAAMADTYERATGEKDQAMEIRRFAESFGKISGIIK
jgi:gliding motility-associated protein GldC